MTGAVDLVRGFRRLRTVVVGDAMLDSYLEGSAARLCSEGPVPVVRKTAEERVPGGAANTAANLRAMGAEVAFVALVGPDAPGARLRQALAERGVGDCWLVEDAGVSTLHKLRILADGQYVVRFDEGETRGASDAGRRRLLASLERALAGADVVVVSDYAYGAAGDDVVARLRALRRERPIPVVVDSKALRRFADAGATVVTPNLLEARLAIQPDGGRDDVPPVEEGVALAERLLTVVDAEHVAVTLAGDGVVLWSRDGGGEHLPAHPVPHANDVGAGDSFAAALALGLAAGAGPVEAARIGIDAAGIAVTRHRTAVVQYQELLQRASLRDLDRQGGVDGAEQLAWRLEAERLAGRAIVFANGVFDILHAGHVEFLRRARALGDVLVVGVNSDRSTRALKGERRPINSERDRLALVAALDAVDHAVLFDDATPANLIRRLRPHIHAKGGDYADERLPESEAVREVGGRVVIVPLAGSLSTSGVIDRIVSLAFDGGSERIGAGG